MTSRRDWVTESARDARAIWDAGVEAVRPETLVQRNLRRRGDRLFVADQVFDVSTLRRLVVVGAGKASAAMAEAVETALGPKLLHRLDVRGLVNVPDENVRPLQRITLHGARDSHRNEPTIAGVEGVARIRNLMADVGRRDVVLALVSGGGSALLPAPVPGVPLADKLAITSALLSAGATIEEMNAVRKHLSTMKGGGLARGFRGRALVSLIISDVIGDPLDVIASGPTAPDPTTFDDALAVLERHDLVAACPPSVLAHLDAGRGGRVNETPRRLPRTVINRVVGSGRHALDGAAREARRRGYRVLDLGASIAGDTREASAVFAGILKSIAQHGKPMRPPVAVLSGGETTVRLTPDSGLGGRNQEMTLSILERLGSDATNMHILCGGTDGEDGPTDAAGAFGDARTLDRAARRGLVATDHLSRHDAYRFFKPIGGLLRTGLTGTNVMDLRVMLVGTPPR
jgi:hydroxypyruvate reductase/glycerate 2-kinase